MYTFKFLQNEANAADRFETIARADNDRKIPVQKVSKLIRISKTIQRAIEHDANIMWEASIGQNDLELKNANVIPISKFNFSKLFKITKEHAKITEVSLQELPRKRFDLKIVLENEYVIMLKINYSDDLERYNEFIEQTYSIQLKMR